MNYWWVIDELFVGYWWSISELSVGLSLVIGGLLVGNGLIEVVLEPRGRIRVFSFWIGFVQR